jgi:hypothetical protein
VSTVDRLKRATPKPVRAAAKRAIETMVTRPTSGARLLPDFLIIGAQRCGTTSLYRYLAQHPAVGPVVITKGAHYFSTNYEKGVDWYRSFFPTRWRAAYVRRRSGTDMVTGEASPYYVFHPLAPERVAATLPDVKLVLMVRDPVGRAYSHHRHMIDRGLETLSFEDALDAEPRRLAGQQERIVREPGYLSFDHQHHSYLARGRYIEQLERWDRFFPRERILVVRSEDFFTAPADVYASVLAFLGLPVWTPAAFPAHNAGSYDEMRTATRDRLREHFAEPNQRLAARLGRDLGWSS